VVVKWYVGLDSESHQERALAVLTRLMQGQVRLLAPVLLLYEVGNALSRRNIDPTSPLRSLLEVPLTLRPPDLPLLSRTAAPHTRIGGTFYDASYAALSEETGLPLLTDDPPLARRYSRNSLLLSNLAP
jgi:predicted nucleic acid-binding protein